MASTIKVNNIQNQCGANIANKCGTTVTLGASGDTITLACGASQTGFGRTGTVDWDTTAKTASFTAVSGNGYFVNTTSGAITVTLPAGSAGDIISLADYAATWQTNGVTVAPNGADKIGGVNASVSLSTEGQSVTFVYTDSTQGWLNTMDSTSNVRGSAFISATGGTETTCGNYKVHTFTGPGTFTVASTAVCATNNNVDYLVLAGGGAGGSGDNGGGGGAGGFRESCGGNGCYTTSPLAAACSQITVTATAFPITVGSGGASNTAPPPVAGGNGSPSVFSTITSTGGGGGGAGGCGPAIGLSGGSGGGGGYGAPGAGGSGNTPPVSPSQGNNGGNGNVGTPAYGTGGGGGAGAAGTAGSPTTAGPGGNGVSTSINFSSTAYAGGGGGSTNLCNSPVGTGGTGGGGTGVPGSSQPDAAIPGIANGTANTGGGGGNVDETPTFKTSGNGGSGIVIIRYRYQ